MARAAQRQREARAPGTNRNYQTAVRHFIKFCNEFAYRPARLSVQDICVLIEYLSDQLTAPGSVLNYMALIRRYILDCSYSTHNWYSHRVKLALDAINRQKFHTPLQRPIITEGVLMGVFTYMARQRQSHQIRLVISILYFSALRQGEVILHSAKQFDPHRHLTAADIRIRDNKLVLHIKHAKNMQGHANRRLVTLAPTGDALTCPVTLFMDLVTRGYKSDPRVPAFTRQGGSPLLVTHVTTALRTAIAAQGLDATLYTLHSLRRTATTNAYAANHKELDIQNSAAWSSNAYKTYIQFDSQSRVNQTLITSLHQPPPPGGH